MPLEKSKCLVCDEIVRGTSGREIFRKDEFGVQTFKERLQVVLQVNVNRKTSHSKVLCMSCVKQLDKIDDYQCNIESFSETFSEALESRQAQESESEDSPRDKLRLCFVCNNSISSSGDGKGVVVGSDDQPCKSLKTRLERALSVSLEKEAASLGGNLELCHPCTDTLGRIERELKVVTDFASTYRGTRVLYADDDYDQDIMEEADDDDDEEEEEEEESQHQFQKYFQDEFDEAPSSAKRRPGRARDVLVTKDAYNDQELDHIEKRGDQLECKLCSYISNRITHMRSHIRSHLGAKPYVCQLCGKGFSDRSNCIKHTRKCNGLEQVSSHDRERIQMLNSGLDQGENSEVSIDLTESPERELNGGTEGEYGCSVCPASFHTVDAANSHMRTHKQSKTSPAESSTSDSGFSSKDNTISSPLPPTKTYEKRYGTPKYLKWKCKSDSLIKQVSDKLYACTACTYQSTYQRLIEHARIHTGEKPYQCPVCPRAYQNNYGYKRHLKEHRKDGIEIPIEQEEDDDLVQEQDESPAVKKYVPASTARKPFECSLCNRGFDSSVELTEHIRGHIEETDKQVSLQRMQNSKPEDENYNNNQPYSQAREGGSSSGQGTGVLPIAEDSYSRQSSSSMDCEDEVERMHDADAMAAAYGSSPIASLADLASEFDRGDDDPTLVSQEFRDSHYVQDLETADYKCLKCPYHNSVLNSMQRHIRIHTGEKPYKCRYCVHRFSDVSNKRKHERKYHEKNLYPRRSPSAAQASPTQIQRPPNQTKSFQSQPSVQPQSVQRQPQTPPKQTQNVQPPKPQIQPQTLPQPPSEAKPFKCSVCQVSFRYESTLKKHQELHQGNQLFSCTMCTRKFTSSLDLQKHVSTVHSKKKDPPQPIQNPPVELNKNNFLCALCNITFPTSSALKQHKLIRHALTNQKTSSNSITIEEIEDSLQTNSLARVGASFRSSIELLENGLYRCILCCLKSSDRLNDILAHQFQDHAASEIGVYEEMVNSGKISLIVELNNGYKCKNCPFKTYFVSTLRSHIKFQHYVDLQPHPKELNEDDVESSLIMRKNPDTHFVECLLCYAKHNSAVIVGKHVKSKHPHEYYEARMKKSQGSMGSANTKMTPSTDEQSAMMQQQLQQHQHQLQQQEQKKQKQLASSRKRSLSQASSTTDTSTKNRRLSDGFPKGQPVQDLPFKCGLCQHMFEEPGDLQVHFGDHCPGHVYPFTSTLQTQIYSLGFMQYFPCQMCGATYLKPMNLQRHIENHAMNLVPLPVRDRPPIKGSHDNSAVDYLQELRQMQDNMQQQHGMQTGINGPGPTGVRLTCVLCGMAFTDVAKLVNHVENHLQNPPRPGYSPQMGNSAISPGSGQIPLYGRPGAANQMQNVSLHPFIAGTPSQQKGAAVAGPYPKDAYQSKDMNQKALEAAGLASTIHHMPSPQKEWQSNVNMPSQIPPPKAPLKIESPLLIAQLKTQIMDPSSVTPINICPSDDYSEGASYASKMPPPQSSSQGHVPDPQLLRRIKLEAIEQSKLIKDPDVNSDTPTAESAADQHLSDEETLRDIRSIKKERGVAEAIDRAGLDPKCYTKEQSLKRGTEFDISKLSVSVPKQTALTMAEAQADPSVHSSFMDCIEKCMKGDKVLDTIYKQAGLKVSDSEKDLVKQIIKESPLLRKAQNPGPLQKMEEQVMSCKDSPSDLLTASVSSLSKPDISHVPKPMTEGIANINAIANPNFTIKANEMATDNLDKTFHQQPEKEKINDLDLPDDLNFSDTEIDTFSDLDFDESSADVERDDLSNLSASLSAKIHGESIAQTEGSHLESKLDSPNNNLGTDKKEMLTEGSLLSSNRIDAVADVLYQAIDIDNDPESGSLPESTTVNEAKETPRQQETTSEALLSSDQDPPMRENNTLSKTRIDSSPTQPTNAATLGSVDGKAEKTEIDVQKASLNSSPPVDSCNKLGSEDVDHSTKNPADAHSVEADTSSAAHVNAERAAGNTMSEDSNGRIPDNSSIMGVNAFPENDREQEDNQSNKILNKLVAALQAVTSRKEVLAQGTEITEHQKEVGDSTNSSEICSTEPSVICSSASSEICSSQQSDIRSSRPSEICLSKPTETSSQRPNTEVRDSEILKTVAQVPVINPSENGVSSNENNDMETLKGSYESQTNTLVDITKTNQGTSSKGSDSNKTTILQQNYEYMAVSTENPIGTERSNGVPLMLQNMIEEINKSELSTSESNASDTLTSDGSIKEPEDTVSKMGKVGYQVINSSEISVSPEETNEMDTPKKTYEPQTNTCVNVEKSNQDASSEALQITVEKTIDSEHPNGDSSVLLDTVEYINNHEPSTSEENTGESLPAADSKEEPESMIDIACSLCRDTSHGKTMYLEHLMTHAKISCPSCSMVFEDIQSLYSHFEIVH